MNIGIAVYCFLSGILLIYDYIKIRKLKRQNKNLRIAIAMSRIASRLAENLINELLERVIQYEDKYGDLKIESTEKENNDEDEASSEGLC